MMDNVLVSRNVIRRLLDVRVLREDGEGTTDHFHVEGRYGVGEGYTSGEGKEEKMVGYQNMVVDESVS